MLLESVLWNTFSPFWLWKCCTYLPWASIRSPRVLRVYDGTHPEPRRSAWGQRKVRFKSETDGAPRFCPALCMNACLWQIIYVHVCFGHSYVSAVWVLWVNSSVPEQLCTENSKQRQSIPFQWAKSTVLALCTGPLFCCVSNAVRRSRTARRVSGVFRNTKTLLYSQLCPQAATDGCSFVLVPVMLGGVEHIDFKAAGSVSALTALGLIKTYYCCLPHN